MAEQWCYHEERQKDRILGSDTGDWKCVRCGEEWKRGSAVPEPVLIKVVALKYD